MKGVILAGGTGLYLRALTEGLFNGPTRSIYWRNRLEMMAERKGRSHLHQVLTRLDPLAARPGRSVAGRHEHRGQRRHGLAGRARPLVCAGATG